MTKYILDILTLYIKHPPICSTQQGFEIGYLISSKLKFIEFKMTSLYSWVHGRYKTWRRIFIHMSNAALFIPYHSVSIIHWTQFENLLPPLSLQTFLSQRCGHKIICWGGRTTLFYVLKMKNASFDVNQVFHIQ